MADGRWQMAAQATEPRADGTPGTSKTSDGAAGGMQPGSHTHGLFRVAKDAEAHAASIFGVFQPFQQPGRRVAILQSLLTATSGTTATAT